jgi:hypothetical protein
VAEIHRHVGSQRPEGRPFDLALEGATDDLHDPRLAAYAEAGVTWWVEAMGWWRGGPDAARSRIEAGPPAAAAGSAGTV